MQLSFPLSALALTAVLLTAGCGNFSLDPCANAATEAARDACHDRQFQEFQQRLHDQRPPGGR